MLQHLTVLAVNGHMDAGGAAVGAKEGERRSDGAVVTVLVTPGEAEVLALAAREGKLDLALRNANDNDSVTTSGTNAFLLLGRPFPGTPSAAASVPPPPPMASRRGGGMAREMRRPPEPSGSHDGNPPPEAPGTIQTIRIGGK